MPSTSDVCNMMNQQQQQQCQTQTPETFTPTACLLQQIGNIATFADQPAPPTVTATANNRRNTAQVRARSCGESRNAAGFDSHGNSRHRAHVDFAVPPSSTQPAPNPNPVVPKANPPPLRQAQQFDLTQSDPRGEDPWAAGAKEAREKREREVRETEKQAVNTQTITQTIQYIPDCYV